MKPVLILFGTNAVSYNTAAALNSDNYYTISLIPENGNKLNKFSNKFNKISVSKYKWDSIDYVNDLISLLKSTNSTEKTLTFLTNDEAITFWIKYNTNLSPYVTILINDLEKFYNKELFYKELINIGIQFPESFSYKNNQKRTYPYLVKPFIKDFGDNLLAGNKFVSKYNSKVLIIRNDEDKKLIQDFNKSQLICQKYIDFKIGDEYSWWGYRNSEGEIISVVANHKSKYPDKFGRISNVKIVENAVVKKTGDAIVEKLNYTGIADIQFIFDNKSNSYFVIEMNPRLWCSHELLLMNNINLIRVCVEEYYNDKKLDNVQYIEGFRQKSNIEWFSILYRIKKFKFFNLKNTEYYNINNDRIKMRLLANTYLLVKFAYYLLKNK